jgi:Domain of unknown function (DUF4917)
MVEVLDFPAALETIGGVRRHLLLGNGFSIALKPDIFSYGSLYDNADFGDTPHIAEVFAALDTVDFEIVIRHLQDAAEILNIYNPSEAELSRQLLADADRVKTALVNAVAKRHPDRPYDVTDEQYAYCRRFLSGYSHIFTLNYDVLLYWALMHTELDHLNLQPDDGFRHPEADPDQPYVSWQQANSATVSYLHGALHLFDNRTEIIKYTWSKTDIPIVDQIRVALDEDKFPLFVSEGTSASKIDRILHNAYLHKSLRSFESCVEPRTAALVVYGHSLAENDDHILHCVARGGIPTMLVSLYGDPSSEANSAIIARAAALVEERRRLRRDRPLSVTFFDAASTAVWG